MKTLRGKVRGRGLRVGVVASRFNQTVTDRLLEGALRGLSEAGVSKRAVTVVSVPGAFEIPSAAAKLAASSKVDAIVCLGAVIRGETEHFTIVANAVQQGAIQVALDSGTPVTFGVLTTETVHQALARSGADHNNKGFEAATDAVEMADLFRQIEDGG